MNEIKIKVKGMVCEGCQNRLKNALLTIYGVESVEANYKTKIVKILLNKEIKNIEIEEKINNLGFEIEEEF